MTEANMFQKESGQHLKMEHKYQCLSFTKRFGSQSTPKLYLYGYGSYGVNLDPYFSSSRLSLLDRNVIFVVAHPRGGGEMGREWYEKASFYTRKTRLQILSLVQSI